MFEKFPDRHCIYSAWVRCRPSHHFPQTPALFDVSFLCVCTGLSAVHRTSHNLNICTCIVLRSRHRYHLVSHCRCYRSNLIQLSLTCPKLSLRLFQTFWRRWHFCPFCPFFGLAPMALLSGRPDYFLEFQKLCFYQ